MTHAALNLLRKSKRSLLEMDRTLCARYLTAYKLFPRIWKNCNLVREWVTNPLIMSFVADRRSYYNLIAVSTDIYTRENTNLTCDILDPLRISEPKVYTTRLSARCYCLRKIRAKTSFHLSNALATIYVSLVINIYDNNLTLESCCYTDIVVMIKKPLNEVCRLS